MPSKGKATIIKTPGEWGATLRARRREGGLTIAEVADRVGCIPRYISEVERGKAGGSLRLLPSLMNELGPPCSLNINS